MFERGRQDALTIWNAAVAAVDSEQLVRRALSIDGETLTISDHSVSLADVGHIEIVGAGKAGAGMARGVEQVFTALPGHISWSGWINVPDDCVDQLDHITLHGARPAGMNEPTQVGVDGTNEILRRVSRLKPADLCLVLISGGGSALLPSPVAGVSLADKLAVTRFLAAAGTSIHELNTVRSRISAVKGGGLARACTARQLTSLIISDVIGDPLDIIASGPTVVTSEATLDPLEVLQRYDAGLTRIPAAVIEWLKHPVTHPATSTEVHNQIVGCNRVALDAAAAQASEMGYQVETWGSENAGDASELGKRLFERLQELQKVANETNTPQVLLAGGETTVRLCDEDVRGKGGRNQEVVLSAVAAWSDPAAWGQLTLLSGGTDGEDGPTPSAGAVADEALITRLSETDLDATLYLDTNNSWPFFEQLDGLINTGPTHTNVMDVQVGIALP